MLTFPLKHCREKPYQLSYLVTKIKDIREILEEQHESCKKEIGDLIGISISIKRINLMVKF